MRRIVNRSQSHLVIFLSVLVIINIILIVIIMLRPKSKPNHRIVRVLTNQVYEPVVSDHFDSPCPEIEMCSTQGQIIKLSDLIGDVIVLRFTKLHSQDLPYLLYLEHLYKRFQKYGIHLFFINLLGKSYSPLINVNNSFFVPLVDDDGYISSLFNARLNDTIIIGRDFKIKFKHNEMANLVIYSQIMRYLFEGSSPPNDLTNRELYFILKKINYRNIKNGKIENLGMTTKGKKSFIALFISQCFGCPEHQRISLMKELAAKIKKDETKIILLFGKGNKFEAIKKFSEKNGLIGYITIGTIQDSLNLSEEEYYQIFKFDVDPRSFILGKNGKILFSEELKDFKKVNINFLIKEVT